jgi:hypothetical protein
MTAVRGGRVWEGPFVPWHLAALGLGQETRQRDRLPRANSGHVSGIGLPCLRHVRRILARLRLLRRRLRGVAVSTSSVKGAGSSPSGSVSRSSVGSGSAAGAGGGAATGSGSQTRGSPETAENGV